MTNSSTDAQVTSCPTSRSVSEISAVCDYLIIIAHGEIVASDTVANLTASADGHRMITFDVRGELGAVQAQLSSLTGAICVQAAYGLGGCVRVQVETAADVDLREDIFRLFAKADLPIIEMNTNDVNLEDVFLRLTAEPLSEEEADAQENVEDVEDAEDVDDPDDAAEDGADADSPYYTPQEKKEKKKKQSADDYKPLFGGRE